jgi:hypothetical protein
MAPADSAAGWGRHAQEVSKEADHHDAAAKEEREKQRNHRRKNFESRRLTVKAFVQPPPPALVAKARRRLPARRAVGRDRVPYAAIKSQVPEARAAWGALITMIWVMAQRPRAWRRKIAIPLLKGGSRDMYTNYRIIAVAATMLLFFEEVWMLHTAEARQAGMHPAQTGARLGTTLVVLHLLEVLLLRRAGGLESWVGFVDFAKFFDRVQHALIVQATAGVLGAGSEYAVGVLDGLLGPESWWFRSGGDGGRDHEVTLTVGAPQGGKISPPGAAATLDPVARDMVERTPGVTFHVRDGPATVAKGRVTDWATQGPNRSRVQTLLAAVAGSPLPEGWSCSYADLAAAADEAGRLAGAAALSVILYVDDLVLAAATARALQEMFDRLVQWEAKLGYTIGIGPQKTCFIVIRPEGGPAVERAPRGGGGSSEQTEGGRGTVHPGRP